MRLNIPKRVKRASGVTFYSRATGWEAEQEESRWVRANERDSTWGHQHEWVGGENEREKKIQKLVRAAHLLYMERNKTTIPPPLPPRTHTHTHTHCHCWSNDTCIFFTLHTQPEHKNKRTMNTRRPYAWLWFTHHKFMKICTLLK